MSYKNEIYLGTVCLEKNRWSSMIPTIKISNYVERLQRAGFDGLELWENHGLMANEIELSKLKNSPLPVKILNTYALGDDGNDDKRAASLELAKKLDVEAIKFNFGRDKVDISTCVSRIDNWLSEFKPNTRFLCEYHDGFNVSYEDIFAAEKIAKSMDNKVEGIIHAFSRDNNEIYKRFAHFGSNITHIHVAYIRKDEKNIGEMLRILKRCGYEGSFSIEFTFGVAETNEDFEYVLNNAVRDLEVLRYYLERE